MAQSLFRQKTLDRANSPESLNEIIRVSNPGIWLLLVSVISLLIGCFIWGIFGTLESVITVDVHVESGRVVCYYADEEADLVKIGQTVRIDGDMLGTVSAFTKETSHGESCIVAMDSLPKNGYYSGEIILDSVKPISFILN